MTSDPRPLSPHVQVYPWQLTSVLSILHRASGIWLAAGTILTGSTAVYDVVRDQIYRRAGERPLEIPSGAVVVPGARAVPGPAAARWGLSLYTPVIIKYRDEKTDAATLLEEDLR